MYRELKIISVSPMNIRFLWELSIYLTSLRKYNLSNKTNILIFLHQKQEILPEFRILEQDFPEAKFFYYKDVDGRIEKTAQAFNYIPIHRPWVLQEHWKKFPELKNDAIFYTDTDIILTNSIDFDKFIHDDVNYLSWTGNKERTNNYIWQPYIDGKISEVDPKKLDQFKKHDVLKKLADICGITREIITENNPNTGGAQYLLKNISSQFWTDVFNHCVEIKTLLTTFNQLYFKGGTYQERENNGYQAFASDMWSVLYTIWKYGGVTKTPIELDFAWSSDKINRASECSILHNAGISGNGKLKIPYEDTYIEFPVFFKGEWQDKTPFDKDQEEYINNLISFPGAKNICSSLYVEAILEAKKNIAWM